MEQVINLVLLSLAVYRITRLIIKDTILEPLREKIWKKFPPSTQFGYLFTCVWCMSFWISLAFSICYTIEPKVAVIAALPFALSAVAGLISTRFKD